ncbi:MAG: hypothetical protein M0R40_07275 [Firmicutes bacterium]|nr:hypothetical protein [Bacillota bacterium]
MYKNLKIGDVIDLCRETGENLNITIPDDETILKEFSLQIPLPFILKNDELQLWIDRYYIAYSRYDETAVHYVYVSKLHINEERNSYKRRKMPNEIKQALDYAERQMDKYNMDYYVSKKFFKFFSKLQTK